MPDQSIELIADLKLRKPTTAERQIRDIERNLFKGSGRAGEPLGRLTGKVSEFDKSLEAANARVIAFGASAAIITTVTTALTQMVVQSIRVEKVLLDINVLLGQSSSSLSKFSDSLFEVAKNTGQSFFDVAEAAKEFSRQGLGVEETLSRTSDAMILTRLTGLDLVKSVEQLTASVNQFSKEGITTADVINRLANVDAKFAVSAKDLSEGLSRAGSVAQDAGASFNELIALVTAVQQRTARGGAVIGNALKTIFTRVSRSDTLDSLEKLGIGVRDLEGNTLPAIRILSELSQKYDEMSSSQKSFTSELVGGGYQINIVKSLFDDLGRTVPEYAKALDVAGRSTDEAYQRNELLNKSFASLANEAGQNLTKLAASFGSLTFGPALKNIFSVINGAGDSIDGNAFLEAGAKVGKGLITGIGDFIGGPGLIYLIALIGKLGKKFGTFAKDSLTDVLSIGAPNAKILDTQKGIVDLVNNEARAHDIVNNALLTQVQKEQQLIILIKEKAAAQAAFNAESLAISTSLVGRGVSYKPSLGKFKTKAGGHMPLPISSVPQEAIQREIVGAKQAGYNIRASDVRVMRASIDGKNTTVVYNNKEKVIHDYMGSGEPAIIPPTGRIANYPGGRGLSAIKSNKSIQEALQYANLLQDIAQVKKAKISFTRKPYEGEMGHYDQDKKRINLSVPNIYKELGNIDPKRKDYEFGRKAGHVLIHEAFHSAYTNPKTRPALEGMVRGGTTAGKALPEKLDAKSIVKFVKDTHGKEAAAILSKEYKGREVEEFLATLSPQMFGFAGGRVPEYKNFAASPKIPKQLDYIKNNQKLGGVEFKKKGGALILDMVTSGRDAEGNRLKGTGILDFAFKQLFSIAQQSGIKQVGMTPINGRVINKAQRLFGARDSRGRAIDFGNDIRLDVAKYADRVMNSSGGYVNAPGGLSNPLNNQRIRLPKGYEAKKSGPKTFKEKLKDLYNRGKNAADRAAIEVTPHIDKVDDVITFVQSMMGFSGGYVNAALGLPLQTYSREELLGTAKKLGVKLPLQIRIGSESEIAKFIGSSRQYKASISRDRRSFDKAGIPYSGLGVSSLATTRGFEAQSRLFEPIVQTPALTALESKIKAENAFGLNPGYQKAQDGRYRTISSVQEALGKAESANPSQSGARSQQEQEQRKLQAAQNRAASLQRARQASLTRAVRIRLGVTSLSGANLKNYIANNTPSGPGVQHSAPIGPEPPRFNRNEVIARAGRIAEAGYRAALPRLIAESGEGFATRTGAQASKNRASYANSVAGVSERLRAAGIANPISNTYQQSPSIPFLGRLGGAASAAPAAQGGRGGGSGGGPPIIPPVVPPAGDSPKKRSLLSRATSFKDPNANARFSSGALALSFAAPLIGGVAAETFGSKDPADQRSNRKIQGVASGLGTGAALGAIVGGPLGAGVGLVVAGFTSLKAILDNTVLSFDDLNEKSKIQAEASQKVIAGIAGYTNALETLQNESLDPNQRRSVERQGQKSLSQLSLEQQQELINAGDDFKKIQDINSRIQEDANKKEAGLDLPKLISSIRTGGYKDGGLGQGVLLNTILQAGKPSAEVDRKQLDERLAKLKTASATAAIETQGVVRRGRTLEFVKDGSAGDFQLPSPKALEAKSQLEGLRAGVLETLGLKPADIAEFSRQIGEASEEQRREFDKLILSAGEGLDNKDSLTKLNAKIVEAQKDISKRLTSIRRSINTESLAGQRASELDSIKKDGSRSRASSVSDLTFSTLRSRLSDAEPYLSAPTSIRLQADADIAQKTDSTNREISKLSEEKAKAIQATLPDTKGILASVPDSVINRTKNREGALGLVRDVANAKTSTGALKSIDEFKKLIEGSTDAETKSFYEKLTELAEKQSSTLKGIEDNTKQTISELQKNLEQDKANAKFEAREKLNKKALETSRRQFNAKDLAANGPQTAGVRANAQKSVDEGLEKRSPLTDPAKLRAQALRYANGPEDRANKQEQFRQQDLEKAIATKAAIEEELNSGLLSSPAQIAKDKEDKKKKNLEDFKKGVGQFDVSKLVDSITDPNAKLGTRYEGLEEKLPGLNSAERGGVMDKLNALVGDGSSKEQIAKTLQQEVFNQLPENQLPAKERARKASEKEYAYYKNILGGASNEKDARKYINTLPKDEQGAAIKSLEYVIFDSTWASENELALGDSPTDRGRKLDYARQRLLDPIHDKYDKQNDANRSNTKLKLESQKSQDFFNNSASQAIADASTSILYNKLNGNDAESEFNKFPEDVRKRALAGGYDAGEDSMSVGSDVSKGRVLLRIMGGSNSKDLATNFRKEYLASTKRASEYQDTIDQIGPLYDLDKVDESGINKKGREILSASKEYLQGGKNKPLTIEEVRKNRIRDLAAANTTIGAQGIVKTVGAGFSPFLSALNKGDYNTKKSFVNPGTSASISSQINAGQFGQVQKTLEGIAPTLSSSGQAQISALIPTLKAGAERLRDNPGNQLKAAEEAAGEELRPVEITDESIEKLKGALKEGAKEGASSASGTTAPTTTVSVTIQGNATSADGNAIGEAVASKIASITEFLSKKFDYAEIPKATA